MSDLKLLTDAEIENFEAYADKVNDAGNLAMIYPDKLKALCSQAKLANALQAENERLREWCGKLEGALRAVNDDVGFTNECISGCGYSLPESSAEDCTCNYGFARGVLAEVEHLNFLPVLSKPTGGTEL